MILVAVVTETNTVIRSGYKISVKHLVGFNVTSAEGTSVMVARPLDG